MTTATKTKKKSTASTLVNRTPFGTTLENGLWSSMEKMAKETRIPKSRLMDEAVTLLLEKRGMKH